VIKLWQFSEWNAQGLYRYEQPPLTQQGADLKSKGAVAHESAAVPSEEETAGHRFRHLKTKYRHSEKRFPDLMNADKEVSKTN